jgi:hypothetical protein
MVSLGDLHLSQGSNLSGLQLEANPNAALRPPIQGDFSTRRLDAIKASFARVDPRGSGYVSKQDLEVALQRYSNLTMSDQLRVANAIGGNSPQPISLHQFTAYYEMLGRRIERDRDFEDLMRHHWGFPEVSDVLDDMKNKFMMVGLAYTFRHGLHSNGSCPELSVEAFQDAIGQVGMAYRTSDIRRVFDAFDGSGSGRPTIEVLKLTGHLTSTSKPPAPLPALYGSAQFHQNSSPMTTFQSSGSSPLHPSHPLHPNNFGSSGGFGSSSGHPQPSIAPPETSEPAMDEPPPQSPPEEEDDGVLAPPEEGGSGPYKPGADAPRAPEEGAGNDDEGYLAPPESGNPNEPPPEAPEEDEDGVYAPPESGKSIRPHLGDDDVQAPAENPRGFGVPSSGSYGSFGGHYGHYGGHHAQPYRAQYPQPAPAYGGLSQSRPTQHGNSGHLAAAAAAGNSTPSGRRRAVTIGINYIGTPNQLNGCINDSDTFIRLLTDEFGYKVSDIRQLRDDHHQRLPTKKNMTAALHWLVNGAQAGDHLFFHYSGHGSQQRDTSGDEMDGKDETIVPCDFQSRGMLSDDDLRRILVASLPAGVRLTIILDCCHSGSACDLPYKVKMDQRGRATVKKKRPHQMPRFRSEADVVMVSGCKDTQTSADIGGAGNSKAAGAMTSSFLHTIKNHPTIDYFDLILHMRGFLKQQGFEQVPQLSSEQFINLSDCFMPEVQPHYESPPIAIRTPIRKALTVGINYLSLPQGRGQLAGCINDSDTMISILKDTYGFTENQIVRLRDDQPDKMPTKANLLGQLRWLVQGAQNGDELFFHYSGHGGQTKDRKGDERDGMDETLIPCDFQSAGQITDDVLHEHIVGSLPKGVRCWVILDCCHSGTALDLQFKVQVDPDGTCNCSKDAPKIPRKIGEAEIIMLSGCKDTQTSADFSGSALASKAAGAMTTAFRHTINHSITCEDLLVKMRQFLKANNFDQVPQMSSDQFLQLDESFVSYQVRKKGKRALPPMMGSRVNSPAQQGPSKMAPSSSAPTLIPPPEAFTEDRLSRLEADITKLRNQQTLSPMRRSASSPMGTLPPGPALHSGMMPLSPQRMSGVPAW